MGVVLRKKCVRTANLVYSLVTALSWFQFAVVLISLLRRTLPTGSRSTHHPGVIHSATVIIAAHNEEGTITRSLRAWQQCTPGPKSILLIDDGSSDGTALKARALSGSMSNLDVWSIKHVGKAQALNLAVKAVDAEIVVIADADTVPHSNVLSSLLLPFSDTNVVLVSASPRAVVSPFLNWLRDIESSMGANLTRHMGNTWNCHILAYGALSAFRRASLLQVGGHPSHLISEDIAITLRMQEIGRVVFASNALAYTYSVPGLHNLEQHRRWLLGALQAVTVHSIDRFRRKKQPPICIIYYVIFRLILPAFAPLLDYFVMASYVKESPKAALKRMGLGLVPSTLTGLLALSLDRRAPQAFMLLPLAQLIIRQYTVILFLYTGICAMARVPLRWRHCP